MARIVGRREDQAQGSLLDPARPGAPDLDQVIDDRSGPVRLALGLKGLGPETEEPEPEVFGGGPGFEQVEVGRGRRIVSSQVVEQEAMLVGRLARRLIVRGAPGLVGRLSRRPRPTLPRRRKPDRHGVLLGDLAGNGEQGRTVDALTINRRCGKGGSQQGPSRGYQAPEPLLADVGIGGQQGHALAADVAEQGEATARGGLDPDGKELAVRMQSQGAEPEADVQRMESLEGRLAAEVAVREHGNLALDVGREDAEFLLPVESDEGPVCGRTGSLVEARG